MSGITVTTRRFSSNTKDTPLSPSAIPDLEVLPAPLASDALPVGLLVSKSSKHKPSSLQDRDYDDVGTRWYKDVILIDASSGRFLSSLGGVWLVKKPEEGHEVGTIEAPSQLVRLLKDDNAALKKVVADEEAKKWIKEHGGEEVGFVVAKREVVNASYKRARLEDVGNGNWEVVREVGGEGKDGKRRPSGLEVETGSKKDVVGVLVKKVVVDGDEITLGDELDSTAFWK